MQGLNAKFRAVLPGIEEKHDVVSDFLETTDQAKDKVAEDKLGEQVQDKRTEDRIEQASRELERSLSQAVEFQNTWGTKNTTSDALLARLPDDAREKMVQELSKWEAELNHALAQATAEDAQDRKKSSVRRAYI